jgi:hypothetical protein
VKSATIGAVIVTVCGLASCGKGSREEGLTYEKMVAQDHQRMAEAARKAQESGAAPDERGLPAAVCTIDMANKTIRVMPWDRQAKRWKKDAIKELSWNEHTELVSGGTTLTMTQFVAGTPLDKDSKTPNTMRGERALVTTDDNGVVRKMEMMALLDGEKFSIAAMAGNDGAHPLSPVGEIHGNKVPCGGAKR